MAYRVYQDGLQGNSLIVLILDGIEYGHFILALLVVIGRDFTMFGNALALSIYILHTAQKSAAVTVYDGKVDLLSRRGSVWKIPDVEPSNWGPVLRWILISDPSELEAHWRCCTGFVRYNPAH